MTNRDFKKGFAKGAILNALVDNPDLQVMDSDAQSSYDGDKLQILFNDMTETYKGKNRLNIGLFSEFVGEFVTVVKVGKSKVLTFREDLQIDQRRDDDGKILDRIIENLTPVYLRDGDYLINKVKENLYRHEREDAPGVADPWDEFTPRSLAEMMDAEIPDLFFPVKELIPVGLTIMSARPKAGKSWLMLDLCISIAEGTPFLGHETVKGGCLYFDFENSDSGVKNRLQMIRQRREIPNNVKIVNRDDIERAMEKTGSDVFPILENGFENILEKTIKRVPDLRLVVIDTLTFIESPQKRNEQPYQKDYRNGRILKRLAEKHHIAIVAITHNTKMKYDADIFSNISGTSGVTASTDLNMVIMKERNNSTISTLAIAGRQTKPVMYDMEFDASLCQWKCIGETSQVSGDPDLAEFMNSDIRKAVVEICENDLAGFTGRISDFINKAKDAGIGIGESPKAVGAFIGKNVGRFMKYHQVDIKIRSNGSSGRTYEMHLWQKINE